MEVDARYIKGMLNSPDINPSASINQWILAILMFHFTLIHVPGSHHTPDWLSRRQPQPGDKEEPEDDFEDWIDNVNRFLHFINPHPSYIKLITHTPPITSYIHSYSNTAVEEQLAKQKEEEQNNTTPYSIISWGDSAITSDRKLEEVKKWLETLKRPPNLSNTKYKSFMCYCTRFVLIANQLWHKDTKKHHQHKMVIPCDRHLFLISSAHNDIGHHGVFATIALLSEWYW